MKIKQVKKCTAIKSLIKHGFLLNDLSYLTLRNITVIMSRVKANCFVGLLTVTTDEFWNSFASSQMEKETLIHFPWFRQCGPLWTDFSHQCFSTPKTSAWPTMPCPLLLLIVAYVTVDWAYLPFLFFNL